MIRMIQVCSTLIVLLFTSCSYFAPNKRVNVEAISPKMDSVEKANIYRKIECFVDKYGIGQEDSFLEDSLCFYMRRLDRRKLMEDVEFKYIAGKLLEKHYLKIRNGGVFPPESFPVYNASILYDSQMSNGFALKIVFEETFNIDSTFNVFAHTWCEFLCIDSVILVLDKLPQMQNDSIHRICKKMVDENKTGGCKW